MTLLARTRRTSSTRRSRIHLHAGVDFVIATDNASTRRDDGDPRAVRARRPPAAPPRAGRRHAPGRVGDADGAARGDRARRGLGDQLRRGRVLVAARRLAEGRPRDRAGAVRRRPGLLAPLPAASRRRRVLRRADDRPSRARRRIPATRRRSSTRTRRSPTARTRDVEIEAGNHNAEAPGLEPLRAWHPLEVLHFSFRSVAQLERKARGGWLRNRRRTSRRCTRSCSTRRSATAASRRSTTRSPSTTTRWRGVSPTARSPSTRACATRCARSAATTGRSAPPAPASGSRSRARASRDDAAYAAEASVARRDRRHRPRRAARARARGAARARSSGARLGAARRLARR